MAVGAVGSWLQMHWNTLRLGGRLPNALVRELSEHSYELVVAALPRKARESLAKKRQKVN